MICKNLPMARPQRLPEKPDWQKHRKPPPGTVRHNPLFLQGLLEQLSLIP
jgi:hypothetical protein